jgi:hypothetical protein
MTERVPKKQNFRRHNTSLIGFMALFSTLPTLVAKHGTWSNTQLGLVSVSRVSARRLNNVYPRVKGVVWGPLGRASPLVSALVTFSHALISPSPDADLNADLLASERACSVS